MPAGKKKRMSGSWTSWKSNTERINQAGQNVEFYADIPRWHPTGAEERDLPEPAGEAIACVQKELTAARRLSRYLADRYPQVQSCRDLNREIIEEYLTYLKTEATGTKHYHADLKPAAQSAGKHRPDVRLSKPDRTVSSQGDIPPTPKAAFKTYSDAELKRLNREIVKLDAQTARLMIIHQMLGTRISDTPTLTPDCLSERNGEIIIGSGR